MVKKIAKFFDQGSARTAIFLTALTGFLIMDYKPERNLAAAAPMVGPDFIFGKIKSYETPPGHNGVLSLNDGTFWFVLLSDGDFDANSQQINLAMRNGYIFISGDIRTRIVDRVTIPRKLSSMSIEAQVDGRYAVTFVGPPSIYYLLESRPWSKYALALLKYSAAALNLVATQDLLVSIDVTTSEIMDVRQEK
jgi:hypothetical protein